jgi:transposase
MARSTFTKPDFKMIGRRGVEQSPRGSHWAIRQRRRILDSLSMTGRQRVRIGCSDGIVMPPLDFSRKLCHYRDCIKSRAAALANLPHRARW